MARAAIAAVTSRQTIGAQLYPVLAAEAGATVTDSGLPYGHLKRYGGIGDGVANDTQALLDAYASFEKVTIPNGIWLIDNIAEIDLDASNRRIVCEPGAILAFTTNGMGLVINGDNVHWQGGHLRGTGVAASGVTERNPSLLLVDGDAELTRRNVSIRGLRVSEANHSGIGAYRAIGVIIKGCTVEDDSGNGATSRFGIWANDCAHVHIQDNNIRGFGQSIGGGGNSGGYAIDSFDGEAGSGLQRGVTVSGNHCSEFADHGVYFSDWQIAYTVSENYTVGGTDSPIKVQGDYVVVTDNICRDAGNGISGRASRQIAITDNLVEVSGTGTNVYGVRVGPDDPFNYDIEDIRITGNVLKSTNVTGAAHGIEVDGIANATDFDIRRLTITDNLIEGYWCKLDANPGGIYVRVGQLGGTAANIDMALIRGNVVDLDQGHTNNNRGVSLLFNANHVRVCDNLLRGFTQHGLYADGCDYLSIDGNHFIGRAASVVNGIRTEVDCTNVRLGINSFEDCDTKINSPTAVGAWRAPQVIEGSAVWNPGNIADGDEEVLEFAVTGAALGDPCIAALNVDVLDLALAAAVTAADTVTVQLLNNTGAAVDVPNGSVFVRVFKRDG